MDSVQRYAAIDAANDAANAANNAANDAANYAAIDAAIDAANDAAKGAAIDAANDAAIDAANDYRRAGLPFPLRRQGCVAFPSVWTQGAPESRECGNVCEITVGLGCLFRYGGRPGLPIPLPDTQGWVAFPAV